MTQSKIKFSIQSKTFLRTLLLALPFTCIMMACDVVQGVLDSTTTGGGGLTTQEVTNGLKTALKKGAQYASNNASQQDGYLNNPIVDIKILMPAELRQVERNVRKIPVVGDKVVDDFVLALNRGAEKAAKEAAPIFINAITSMSIQDAMGILKGDSTAATQYLQRTTSSQLSAKFEPVLKDALDQVGAYKYYNGLQDAISTYNKTPLVQDINIDVKDLPVLEEYATQKALDGLFTLVAREEKEIRRDPFRQAESILRKVFGSVK